MEALVNKHCTVDTNKQTILAVVYCIKFIQKKFFNEDNVEDNVEKIIKSDSSLDINNSGLIEILKQDVCYYNNGKENKCSADEIKQFAFCATEQSMVNAPYATTAYNDVKNLQSKDPEILKKLIKSYLSLLKQP
jgi:hypothetical protein